MKKLRFSSLVARDKQKKILGIVAFVHALALAGSGQAEETAPAKKDAGSRTPEIPSGSAEGEIGQMDEVVVQGDLDKSGYQADKLSSTKYTQPLLNTAQTVNIIPQALMEDQNATSLRDVLRNVPGISFQAGEGGVPAGDQLSIRGFSARTDLFVDGVRDIGGYTRDSFNFEQIEVVKGPASAYTGRGSTGGSVNMVTKAPRDQDFYHINAGYGTDEYYRTSVDINQTVPENEFDLGGVGFRLNGLFHSQEMSNRDYVSDERWGIAPSLTFGMGTPTRVTLTYSHLEENNTPSYGLPFVASTAAANAVGGGASVGHVIPAKNDTFYGLVNRDYEKITNDIGGLDVVHDFHDDLSLSNKTRYGRTFRDSIIAAPRINTGTGLITRELQARYQTDQVATNQTSLTSGFETWNLRHTVVAGFEYSRETSLNRLRSTNPPFGTPATGGNPYDPNAFDDPGSWSFTGAENESFSDSLGASVFDTVEITEQWILSLGVRFDHFNTTYEQTPAANVANQSVTTLKNNDDAFTWRTSLVYKPVSYGSIYFGYGTSINPSGENLTLAANIVNLEPEESETFELGTKWDLLGEKLSLSAALFRTDKTNFRTTDPVTSEISTSGEVRIQGIELGVAGNITPEWAVYAGYTLMESEIMKSTTRTAYNGLSYAEQGHEVSNTPEQSFNLWTTYRLPWGFEAGTGVNFVDQRFANNINTNSVEGYWLQDLMISYKVNDHMSVQVNVNNLWDKEYIDRVGGGHAIPGAGRSVVASTSLRF